MPGGGSADTATENGTLAGQDRGRPEGNNHATHLPHIAGMRRVSINCWEHACVSVGMPQPVHYNAQLILHFPLLNASGLMIRGNGSFLDVDSFRSEQMRASPRPD
jgi:hypothetical protein